MSTVETYKIPESDRDLNVIFKTRTSETSSIRV